jgi:AraC-like DNA-binding protein
MQLTFAEPNPAIQPFVTAYYLFEDEASLIDDGQRADCGHLRFFMRGKGHQVLPNSMRLEATPAMLVGPQTVASRFTVQGPLRFAGCSLQAAAWGGLLDLDASTLCDSGCDGAPHFSGQLDSLITELDACPDVSTMGKVLDRELIKLVRPVPADHAAVNKAIQAWLKSQIFPNVDDLYAVCPVGERQVMRIANRYWGAPPKALARKYGALRTASHIMKTRKAPPAAEAYYSDHSHLIREVKRVTGMTPRQLNTISNMILRLTLDDDHFRELDPIDAPVKR